MCVDICVLMWLSVCPFIFLCVSLFLSVVNASVYSVCLSYVCVCVVCVLYVCVSICVPVFPCVFVYVVYVSMCV